jgi:hydrogen peroxide-dependent heme synthase
MSTCRHTRRVHSPAPEPPVTVEGWYALHQVLAIDRAALRRLPRRADACESAAETLAGLTAPADGGWSAMAELVGSTADVLCVHLRPTLDALRDVQHALGRLELMSVLRPTFTLLGVTEVGLYHLPDRDEPTYEDRLRAEAESAHTRHRLYPALPVAMPYVCFYPTSKRRDASQNWYALSLAERSALMQRHGLTGRRHAAHVRQIITGAIGLATWEWGVTLFAADPSSFKRVVTDMRFDEASARYAEFGDFYVGRVIDPRAWAASVGA